MSINYQEFLEYLENKAEKSLKFLQDSEHVEPLVPGYKEKMATSYLIYKSTIKELIRNHEAWLFAHKETLCACCDKPVGKDVVCYECYNHDH